MKLAIIGDFRKENATHVATNKAIQYSLEQFGFGMEVDWVRTATIPGRINEITGYYDGFLIAPGSPYESMEGVLNVIRFARENRVPTLGTCGGFQHMTIEFARNVLGVAGGDHAETNPDASSLIVTPLSCSLVGQRLDIVTFPGTKAFVLAGPSMTENYYCNFGLNPAYQQAIHDAGFRISGTDDAGEVRILELDGHPFFMGTLFVPQASSTAERPHPIVSGFLRSVFALG
jgi:CTP synthase (UTP-ammonia lyase)